jgi:hypothetical protein
MTSARQRNTFPVPRIKINPQITLERNKRSPLPSKNYALAGFDLNLTEIHLSLSQEERWR